MGYHIRKAVKELKLNEKDYVFFPVNDNKELDSEGDSHWSLLVYASDEKHRGFYHHDPLGSANLQHATELMERLSETSVFPKFKIIEEISPKQINNYECGIYTLIYAGTLARDIAKGVDHKRFNITPEEVSKCRKTLRQRVSVEKLKFEKEKKAKEIKQDNIKKINNDNIKRTGSH